MALLLNSTNKPHFVVVPFMSQGHLIPLIDIGRLLAKRNATVTIITTPQNAARFGSGIDRDIESGLAISVLQLHFPAEEFGLPEGCETVDNLPSFDMMSNFSAAMSMLQQPMEKLIGELKPNCIIHDRHFTWFAEIVKKFQNIPRILFDGKGCFTHVWAHNISASKVHECVPEGVPFAVPGLSDRIEFTTSQLPGNLNPGSNVKELSKKITEAEEGAYGLIVNSFDELEGEGEYVQSYQKIKNQKVWCVGPVSLCNEDIMDKAKRGNNNVALTSEKNQCLMKWLDLWPSNSVIYVSFGSLSRLTHLQLIELGSALEGSKRPFVWVIREGNKRVDEEETEEWLIEDGFENRVKGRGFLIRGWAPQVLILSHPSVGGFLTHCGWNSTLEGICAGVPMITWPMFAEQFFNEKLLVQKLRVGVRVGVEVVVNMGEEYKAGVVVKREDVEKAIESLMDGGEEGEERRKRARRVAEMAKKAVEEGGSSYLNITLIIEDIMQQATCPALS